MTELISEIKDQLIGMISQIVKELVSPMVKKIGSNRSRKRKIIDGDLDNHEDLSDNIKEDEYSEEMEYSSALEEDETPIT